MGPEPATPPHLPRIRELVTLPLTIERLATGEWYVTAERWPSLKVVVPRLAQAASGLPWLIGEMWRIEHNVPAVARWPMHEDTAAYLSGRDPSIEVLLLDTHG